MPAAVPSVTSILYLILESTNNCDDSCSLFCNFFFLDPLLDFHDGIWVLLSFIKVRFVSLSFDLELSVFVYPGHCPLHCLTATINV